MNIEELFEGTKLEIRLHDGVDSSWRDGMYARPCIMSDLHWVWVDGLQWQVPLCNVRIRDIKP